MSARTIVLACSLALFAAFAHAEVRYRVLSTSALPLPYVVNSINGMTDTGFMAGTSTDTDKYWLGFVIHPDGSVALIEREGYPWFESYVEDVNDEGHAIGRYWDTNDSPGFLWTPDDEMTIIEPPAGTGRVYPTAINIFDVVCGSTSPNNSGSAFRWTADDGAQDLGVRPGDTFSKAENVNDSGRIVGWSGTATATRAVYWDPSNELIELPATADFTPRRAYGINNAGQIFGIGQSPEGSKAFIWDTRSGVRVLTNPVGLPDYGIAYDVNEHGVAVGAAGLQVQPSGFQIDPVIWDPAGTPRLLTSLLDPCERGGSPAMTYGRLITNDGRIYLSAGNVSGWLLTPYLYGDLDENGAVDLRDLTTLLSNLGRTGSATYADGDLNCTASVNLTDLGLLLPNFGTTLP